MLIDRYSTSSAGLNQINQMTSQLQGLQLDQAESQVYGLRVDAAPAAVDLSRLASGDAELFGAGIERCVSGTSCLGKC